MLTTIVTRSEFRIIVISLAVLLAERFRPWRKDQPFGRKQLIQDVVWFGFNAFAIGYLFGPVFGWIGGGIKSGMTLMFGHRIAQIQLLAGMPLYIQIPVALVVVDFVEWCTHYLLHRVPFLWRFHRVHHSIHDMDWIGNFRFHPFEIFFYYSTKFIPVMILGGSKTSAIVVGSLALLIGNLNHANLNLSYGPFRYILNSPRMHIWHHEAKLRGSAGKNFGIVLSIWDWMFKTAYMPLDRVPERLGFEGDSRFPDPFWRRMVLPFLDKRSHA